MSTLKLHSGRPKGMAYAVNHADKMRANGTLRPREWEQFDAKIQDVTRERAGALGYIIGKGLTVNGSFGKTVSFYARMSDVDNIKTSIHPSANREKDQQEFDEIGVKVPLIHGSFDIDDRTLDASRNQGESLDVSTAAALTKNIWIEANNILANGWGLGGDNAVYGLRNRPGAGAVGITASVWNGSSPAASDGATIDGNVNAALANMYSKNFFGPFVLFLAKNFWASFQRKYSDQYGDLSIMSRIMEYVDIEAVLPLDQLPDNTAVLVQLTDDVIDIYLGMDLMPFEFASGPMMTEYCIATALAPRVKQNYNNDVGIVVLS